MALAAPAFAHKPSDSYMTLRLERGALSGQWDIALRDLDFALGLDADGDGTIRWGEVKAKRDEIERYALARLFVESDGRPCQLKAGDLLIDQHSDGAYAVLPLSGACPGPVARLDVGYRLFADIDPQHRGLIHVVGASGEQTLVLGAQRDRQSLAMNGWGVAQELVDFLRTGVFHIWSGFDHLLFLISLLLPAVLVREDRGWSAQPSAKAALGEVLQVVSAFTVAHSITLSLATLGVVSVPARVSESVIALSVVAAALNNLRPVVTRRVWVVAFVFGLVHGFGFANVLHDLGLAKASLLRALLAFNVGVEVGQLAIVALVMPVAWFIRRTPIYRQALLGAGSLVITLVASLWFCERALSISLF
jgi:hypothetical protein